MRDFLQPIAEQNPNNFIEGVLLVWLDKNLLEGLNLSKSLEKLMQILISLRLKPEIVIAAVNKFVEKRNLLSKKPGSKKLTKLARLECYRES